MANSPGAFITTFAKRTGRTLCVLQHLCRAACSDGNPFMYDVIIIGAGPAGSTLARLIGKRYRVLLVDKGMVLPENGKAPSAKCCGGLLAPDAQRMLARMELGLPREILTGPQLFAVRTIDLLNRIERYYQRSYLNIDRGRFDQWLASLLPPDVELRQTCFFRGYAEDEEGLRVHLSQDGGIHEEYTSLLIGADGAFSLVRKQAFPQMPAPRQYVAIQEWFRSERPLPYFTALFDPEVTDFYSWLIPKDDKMIVGSALRTGETATANFELLKSKLRDYGFDLTHSIEKNGSLLMRPVKTSQVMTGRGRVALIGEAAGWISPSSAEGISYGFRSALALADALMPGIEGFQKRYARKTRRLRSNIRLKNLKAPFMYNRILRRFVMTSGIHSIDVSSP